LSTRSVRTYVLKLRLVSQFKLMRHFTQCFSVCDLLKATIDELYRIGVMIFSILDLLCKTSTILSRTCTDIETSSARFVIGTKFIRTSSIVPIMKPI